jgi:hypothetical protein
MGKVTSNWEDLHVRSFPPDQQCRSNAFFPPIQRISPREQADWRQMRDTMSPVLSSPERDRMIRARREDEAAAVAPHGSHIHTNAIAAPIMTSVSTPAIAMAR